MEWLGQPVIGMDPLDFQFTTRLKGERERPTILCSGYSVVHVGESSGLGEKVNREIHLVRC